MALLTLEERKKENKKHRRNFEITNCLKLSKMVHHKSKAQQNL
jgi:hypothetical protein